MMYLFINEHTVEAYNGEILKRFVGSKMVKAISNPTNKDLKEFGYMELVEDIEPEYDIEKQCVSKTYYVQDGKIYEKYKITEITAEELID